MSRIKHRGGCHCGAVQFEVEAPAELMLTQCNCSICAMSGFLHLMVPASQFQLIAGREQLSSYRFGTETAEHLFCSRCGVKSFYHPRSEPTGITVNANCLQADTIRGKTIKPFDGQNWEENISKLKHRSS